MKSDLVLAGVGGQGILTIAAIIGQAAVSQNIHVKQSEVHGMAQRGGSVVAHLRLSSDPIASDLIAEGTADILLSMEPLEALRHASYLKSDGVLLTNTTPVVNIDSYPEMDKITAELKHFKRTVILDGDAMAQTITGSARAVNMILLGAVSVFLDMPSEIFIEIIKKMFARKGDAIVEANIKAYKAGQSSARAASQG
ncbi:MAG: indolepyruvate oxidoreductase subunit beta [Lentisphaeria bacterium]